MPSWVLFPQSPARWFSIRFLLVIKQANYNSCEPGGCKSASWLLMLKTSSGSHAAKLPLFPTTMHVMMCLKNHIICHMTQGQVTCSPSLVQMATETGPTSAAAITTGMHSHKGKSRAWFANELHHLCDESNIFFIPWEDESILKCIYCSEAYANYFLWPIFDLWILHKHFIIQNSTSRGLAMSVSCS